MDLPNWFYNGIRYMLNNGMTEEEIASVLKDFKDNAKVNLK